jgi:hypothetical protein
MFRLSYVALYETASGKLSMNYNMNYLFDYQLRVGRVNGVWTRADDKKRRGASDFCLAKHQNESARCHNMLEPRSDRRGYASSVDLRVMVAH